MPLSFAVRETPKEIHRYPLRPEGEEEPLWMTPEWRRRVLDNLCDAPWLHRASELLEICSGTSSVHRRDEPVYVLRREGRVSVVRCVKPVRQSWRKRPVTEVAEAWREVCFWWDAKASIDRIVVRMMLAGGPVVDLARSRSAAPTADAPATDGWSLVGVVD